MTSHLALYLSHFVLVTSIYQSQTKQTTIKMFFIWINWFIFLTFLCQHSPDQSLKLSPSPLSPLSPSPPPTLSPFSPSPLALGASTKSPANPAKCDRTRWILFTENGWMGLWPRWGPEHLRGVFQKKQRYFLGIFPKMGGAGSPQFPKLL